MIKPKVMTINFEDRRDLKMFLIFDDKISSCPESI